MNALSYILLSNIPLHDTFSSHSHLDEVHSFDVESFVNRLTTKYVLSKEVMRVVSYDFDEVINDSSVFEINPSSLSS